MLCNVLGIVLHGAKNNKKTPPSGPRPPTGFYHQKGVLT
jgi:hypothetical protein